MLAGILNPAACSLLLTALHFRSAGCRRLVAGCHRNSSVEWCNFDGVTVTGHPPQPLAAAIPNVVDLTEQEPPLCYKQELGIRFQQPKEVRNGRQR